MARIHWRSNLAGLGRPPDPRFTLANERTFLAWIRTALALIAGGIGLETFAAEALPDPLRAGLSGSLLVLGAVLALFAFLRWLANERSLRLDRPLTLPGAPLLLSAGLGAVSGALAVAVVMRA